MQTKRFGALTSSQDANEIANKVKGAILGFSSIIIFLAAQFFNIHLSANDIISLATELSAVAGAVWCLYGFALHGIKLFYDWKNGTLPV